MHYPKMHTTNFSGIIVDQTNWSCIKVSLYGKLFTDLEPIMGTYAHIVGFSEDQKTVIHIHPYGRAPTRAEDRGGPAFAFKLHVPSAGFLRLYGQVQIDGVSQFAPFGLMILPAEKPTTKP